MALQSVHSTGRPFPTPGHTRGHFVILVALFYSASRHRSTGKTALYLHDPRAYSKERAPVVWLRCDGAAVARACGFLMPVWRQRLLDDSVELDRCLLISEIFKRTTDFAGNYKDTFVFWVLYVHVAFTFVFYKA